MRLNDEVLIAIANYIPNNLGWQVVFIDLLCDEKGHNSKEGCELREAQGIFKPSLPGLCLDSHDGGDEATCMTRSKKLKEEFIDFQDKNQGNSILDDVLNVSGPAKPQSTTEAQKHSQGGTDGKD